MTDLNAVGAATEKVLVRQGVPHERMMHGLIVAEEGGEVARAVLKEEQGIRGTREFWRAQLRRELASVVLAAAALAVHDGIDLDRAVADHLAEIEGWLPGAFHEARPPA